MKPGVSATSKGEWLHESGNKTSASAARRCDGGRAGRHPERCLQQEEDLQIRRVGGGCGQGSTDSLHWEPLRLFCGLVRNRWTFFRPFPGIAVASKGTEVTRQSSLSCCHHRAPATPWTEILHRFWDVSPKDRKVGENFIWLACQEIRFSQRLLKIFKSRYNRRLNCSKCYFK